MSIRSFSLSLFISLSVSSLPRTDVITIARQLLDECPVVDVQDDHHRDHRFKTLLPLNHFEVSDPKGALSVLPKGFTFINFQSRLISLKILKYVCVVHVNGTNSVKIELVDLDKWLRHIGT